MKTNRSLFVFNKEYVTIALVLCVCFLAISLSFLYYMMDQGQEESTSYLWQDAKQKQISIEGKVQGDFQTLDGVASLLFQLDFENSQQLINTLQRVNDQNSFTHMGIATQSGTVSFVKVGGKLENSIDLSKAVFFQQALKGKSSVSNAHESPFSKGTKVIYYGVPVFDKDNKVTGVLCAIDDASQFLSAIDTPVFHSEGFSNLVDDSGLFVVCAQKSIEAQTGASNFEETGAYSRMELDRLMGAVKRHEKVEMDYFVQEEAYRMVINPISINGWCIMSSVPQSVLKATYNRINIGVMIIVIAAIIVFFILFNYQWSILNKNQKKLTELAYVDSLTGGRNFSKFLIDAEDLMNTTERYAVWYCDFKNFKYVNDLFGYEHGDILLKHFVKALRAIDEEMIFCRSSADNFVGICIYESEEQLEGWFQSSVNQIQEEVGEFIDAEYVQMYAGFYCHEKDGEDLSINDMVDRAKIAQEAIKTATHSACTFFTEELRLKNLRAAEMEAEGKSALQRGDFVLYFQPKINIQQSNQLVGAEVLVRWPHSEKGLISPGEFIPLFEKRGLIVTLDRYVFEKACQWVKAYLDGGNDPIAVSVNVSQLGLLTTDFVEYYTTVKDKYGIPDHVMELEFTESVILEERESSANIVGKLQENGFFCSIDDFGSGYSSLNMLKNLRVNTLKLDMGFFRKEEDRQRTRTVISNVINMSRELSMTTIAEGVETVEMVEFLQRSECDIIQGYVFERPMPAKEFETLLQKKKGEPFTPQDC